MPHGKSRPLAAPFFNQDALWKHGIAYAGNAPALVDRQNYAENGNKNSRRDHKTPFAQTNLKEITMTTTQQTQSRKSSPTVSGTTDELGAIFKDVLTDELPKELKAALQPGFQGLSATIAHLAQNQTNSDSKATASFDKLAESLTRMADSQGTANGKLGEVNATISELRSVLAELGGKVSVNSAVAETVKVALEANTEEVKQVVTHMDAGFGDFKKGLTIVPSETVMQKNKFFSRDNVKGDVRTVSVAGIGVGIVLGIKAIVEAIFSDPQPMQVPVRKAA